MSQNLKEISKRIYNFNIFNSSIENIESIINISSNNTKQKTNLFKTDTFYLRVNMRLVSKNYIRFYTNIDNLFCRSKRIKNKDLKGFTLLNK